MNLFFYIILFIMGILFGSFYTLAVHRIPKRQDITHTHSYCPNCNNKLGFFELIPVLSYLILRGKCKHCGEKIRIRYFILEILSGISFVLFGLALDLNIYTINKEAIISFVFIVFYLTCIFLIAGIDKENRKIEKSVISYGIILSIIYIIYLYVLEEANIYRYGIYLILFIIMLIIDNITLRRRAKNSYVNSILLLSIIMVIFTGEYIYFNTVICTLLATAIYLLIKKIKNAKARNKKEDKQLANQISIGYLMCMSNVITFLTILYLANRM